MWHYARRWNGRDSIATSGNWPNNEMTATPSAAGRPPPPPPLAQSPKASWRFTRLLGEWRLGHSDLRSTCQCRVAVFFPQRPPASSIPATHCRHGKPANERRRARNKRRREAWIERRQICTQSGPLRHMGMETDAITSPAPADDAAVLPAATMAHCNDEPETLPAAVSSDHHDEPGMP